MKNTTADTKDIEERKELNYSRNKRYGTLSISPSGWSKEVCNVSWNEKNPKLDIREWDASYTKMSKGITLTKEETKKLLDILKKINFEEFDNFKSDMAEAIESIDAAEDAAVNA